MTQNYLLIRIIHFFKGIFKHTKIDYDALVSILKLKLTMDTRRTSVSMGEVPKEPKNKKFNSNLIMQVFVGIFMGFIMYLPFDLFFKMSIIISMDLFFMVLYMISDFSNVLLDVRDKNIIMTKPVGQETMNAARIIHIIYYMLLMFAALNLVAMVVGVMTHGWLILLAFALLMLFLSFFIVFLTTILYSFLLNRFNGEKLKDIINVFQIFLSVVTIIAYQLMGRVFQFSNLSFQFEMTWWTYLLPPAWFASLFNVIVEGVYETPFIVMSILAILVPTLLGWVLIKQIMPKFENYLNKLQVEDGVFENKNTLKNRMKEKLYAMVTKDHVERAFIRFSDYNLSRDRRLKLMIYPNYVMSFIFPIIMILPFIETADGIAAGISSLRGSMSFTVLYMAIMFFITNFEFVQYSDNYDAAFIYDSFPIENKRLIKTGAMKAYYIKYVLPGMLILSLLFGALYGVTSWPGLILMQFVCFLMLKIRVIFFNLDMPFSRAIGTTANKNIGTTFAFMGICGLIAGIHYFLIKQSVGLSSVALAVVILTLIVTDKLKIKNNRYSIAEN